MSSLEVLYPTRVPSQKFHFEFWNRRFSFFDPSKLLSTKAVVAPTLQADFFWSVILNTVPVLPPQNSCFCLIHYTYMEFLEKGFVKVETNKLIKISLCALRASRYTLWNSANTQQLDYDTWCMCTCRALEKGFARLRQAKPLRRQSNYCYHGDTSTFSANGNPSNHYATNRPHVFLNSFNMDWTALGLELQELPHVFFSKQLLIFYTTGTRTDCEHKFFKDKILIMQCLFAYVTKIV